MNRRKIKPLYVTRCDGTILREKVNSILRGLIYTAQEMTDTLAKDNLWEKGTNDDVYFIGDTDFPSPVTYNGKEYDFFDIWKSGEYLPTAFILVEKEIDF